MLRDQIDKLHEALEAENPRVGLASRYDQLSALETELRRALDAAVAEVNDISAQIEQVTGAKGREAEVAALQKELTRRRSTLSATAEAADRQLVEVRAALDKELARNTESLTGIRKTASDLAGEAARLVQTEERLVGQAEVARLRLSATEARAAWEATAPSHPAAPAAELDATTMAAVNKVARAYEEGLTETAPVRAAVAEPDAGEAFRLRSMATRDAILTQAQARAPSERIRPAAMADVAGLTDAQRELVRDAQRVFRADEPRSWAGEQMRNALIERARVEPGFRAKLVSQASSLRSGFRGALERFGGVFPAGRPFWRELALTTLNLVSPHADLVADPVAREAFVQYEEVNRFRFLKEVGADAGVEAAVEAMQAGDAGPGLGRTKEYVGRFGGRGSEVGAAVDRIGPFEPAIEVPYDRNVNLPDAVRIAQQRAAEVQAASIRAAGEHSEASQPGGAGPISRGSGRVGLRGHSAPMPTDSRPSPGSIRPPPSPRWSRPPALKRTDQFGPEDFADWTASSNDPRRRGNSGFGVGRRRRRARGRWTGPRRRCRSASEQRGAAQTARPRAGEAGEPRSSSPSEAPWVAMRPTIPTPRTMRVPAPSVSGAVDRSFANAVRARSFFRLRGFARVGGVLIGREPGPRPESAPALDLLGIHWELDGDRVRLIVKDRGGQETTSRWFPRETVALALAYAADGRPTTVTMVEARPLEELRILLHPALVDTPLGRHVVQIDRFVDTFARTRHGGPYFSQWRIDEAVRVDNQLLLYKRAWAVRLGLLADWLERQGRKAESLKKRSDALLEQTGGGLGQRLMLTFSLRNATAPKDPDHCLLTAKPDFFDGALVKTMVGDDAPATVEAFDEKVRAACREELDEAEKSASSFLGSTDELKKLIQRWQVPVPTFTIWSGVRETHFAPTLDEVFPAEGREARPAVDFMLQVAFTSPPYFGDGGLPDLQSPGANDELQKRYDHNPWEFPSIAPKVREAVVRALEDPANAPDKETYDAVSEFVAVQRFFRVGFAGGLGAQFPVELLAELHDALTAGRVATPARTPRWNVRTGNIEAKIGQVAQEARQKLDAAKGEAGPSSKRLADALDDLSSRCKEYRERWGSLLKDASTPGASDAPDKQAAARRQVARQKAWNKFDAWDRSWEKGVLASVKTVTAMAKVLADDSAHLDRTPDEDRCLSVLNGPPKVGDLLNELASALEMRRALNVSEDDRELVLSDKPRRIRTLPAPARPADAQTVPPPAAERPR